MYFDTHAHYDDEAFDADRDELLSSLPEAGVTLVIDPGCDVSSSEKAIALAERFPHVYAAVGIHPEELGGMQAGDLEKIEALCESERCVAIGEIGLDYYWDDTHKEEQKALFIQQLELAIDHDLPVIIHDREAHGDSLDIVRRCPDVRGVFHCFLKRGWYLGFDGPITYKNARKAIEVLEICPLDRLLIETDSPYLAPVPFRGKRNDPAKTLFVLQKLAEIRSLSPEDLSPLLFENGKRLFHIE